MEGLFKYVEAEALDRLNSPPGATVTKIIILVEVEHHTDETPGASRLALSRHHDNRALRESEEAGLIVKRLGDVL
jgi:hypothetical protein